MLEVPCASINNSGSQWCILKCLSLDVSIHWTGCWGGENVPSVCLVVSFLLAVLKLLYMLSIILDSLNKKAIISNSPVHVYHNHMYLDYLSLGTTQRAVNKDHVFSCLVTVTWTPKKSQLAWVWSRGWLWIYKIILNLMYFHFI